MHDIIAFGVPKETRLYEGSWSDKVSHVYLTPTGIGFSTPKQEGKSYAVKETQIVPGPDGLCGIASLLATFELPKMIGRDHTALSERFAEIGHMITALAELEVPEDKGNLFAMLRDSSGKTPAFKFDEEKCCNEPYLDNCRLPSNYGVIKGCLNCSRLHTATNVGTNHTVFKWFLEKKLDATIISHDSASTLQSRDRGSQNALVFSPPEYQKVGGQMVCTKVGHMGILAKFTPEVI